MNDSNNLEILKGFAKGKDNIAKKGGRAVIYSRVSSKEQVEGFSLEVQMEKCEDYAKRKGYVVVERFGGTYESGKSDKERKEFNKMLKYVKAKKNYIDAVIVYSTSRFSRSGSTTIIEELKACNIPVLSASTDYDPREISGEMMQGMELLNARIDNAVKSRAVKDAGKRALESGRWISKAPRGYDMKTTKKEQVITINHEGELIREAFLMKANEGLSNEDIRVHFKARGLDLCKQSWSHIFSNIFYAGYFAHPFLLGEIIKGGQPPLISLEVFCKVNGLTKKAHNRGYEVKTDKPWAPLLGTIRCKHCGKNMTASLSTKMRKKYGREIGYYTCSRKGCKHNVATKVVNEKFAEMLETLSVLPKYAKMFNLELNKMFPILNKQNAEAAKAIKFHLTEKEKEIEKVKYNLATAMNSQIQEICLSQLEKLEAEKAEIERELEDSGLGLLNLSKYIDYGLSLKDNIMKMWKIASLPHKRSLQKVLFPEGIFFDKETDDIEPVSRNEFLFARCLNPMNYGEKEKGQTLIFEDLSNLAPQVGLEPTTP